MEKETNKLIAAHYQLFTINENGERNLVEETTQEQPFVFITGFGTALDAFEDILKDLGRGEKFDFELDKDKSFGEYDPKRVIELNKEMFTVDGHFDSKNIFKGAQIPLKNEDGNFFIAKVLEIGADKVKVDLNHPLAGNKLNFKGYVIENREDTDSAQPHERWRMQRTLRRMRERRRMRTPRRKALERGWMLRPLPLIYITELSQARNPNSHACETFK